MTPQSDAGAGAARPTARQANTADTSSHVLPTWLHAILAAMMTPWTSLHRSIHLVTSQHFYGVSLSQLLVCNVVIGDFAQHERCTV